LAQRWRIAKSHSLDARIVEVKTLEEVELALARFADEGALMSYGPNFTVQFRRAAYFVDRILKGAKPADLPFEQPTQVEFVVNMKTASALGLKMPQELLPRADRVIE
jgi:putative ABC transport system substrate-binding protein